MKTKLSILGASLALAFSNMAQADFFTFDPTGTAGASGDIANIALIDQAPGNALALGGINAIQHGAGSSLTLYYQANLSNMQYDDTSIAFSNGAGGKYFTFVAGFGEIVETTGLNNSATFRFDPTNPVNFFNMYATTAVGNNLTGQGFVNGSPILKGHVVGTTSSDFTITRPDTVNLDQSPNGDNWSGQKTVQGSGSSDITIMLDYVDSNYFPSFDLTNSIVVSFFNTSQVDPYRQVDPSKCFNTATSLCTTAGLIPNIGAINGASGPDFIFQADANQSLQISEPATLALLGFGLVGLGLMRRGKTQA